jgi:hypothetical protein
VTLVRTCCCQGCFANDDCPVPYTGLGDFTYEATVDTGAIAGNFALQAITDIRVNPRLDPNPCYASNTVRDKCCITGSSCTPPVDTLVEKYFDRMMVPEVLIERTNYPCYTVVSSPKSIPGLVLEKKCSADRTVEGRGCYDVGDECSELFPDCYQGPQPNYYTELGAVQGAYAADSNGQACGDYTMDFTNGVDFGALTVGSGTIRMRRNAQSTFSTQVISGSGLTNISYWHRANICDSTSPTECGPCTQNQGTAGQRCSEGRCCCRSVLQFTFEVKRAYSNWVVAWNSVANAFTFTPGTVQYWTQTVRCTYEGPVDERLYVVTGTSALRTFTLLNATIFEDTFNLGPGTDARQWTLDYCPYEVSGAPGTVSGGGSVAPTSIVDDECELCVPASPPVPGVLSMEQAERLGIKRLITVTRTTP